MWKMARAQGRRKWQNVGRLSRPGMMESQPSAVCGAQSGEAVGLEMSSHLSGTPEGTVQLEGVRAEKGAVGGKR